jgi:hypothetical protein
MKRFIKLVATICLLMTTKLSFGQNAEMADTFRSEGKIYVVVAIILIVLAGLLIYLFMLDKKLTRIERQIAEKQQTK